MAHVLRRHAEAPRRLGQSGGGFLSVVGPLARTFGKKALEEAQKKGVEAAGKAAGKVVEAAGERAAKAIKGQGVKKASGALVQKNYSLEQQVVTGGSDVGNQLALLALGEPVKGAGFARPPKPKKGVVRTTQATKDARKHTKKTVAALAAISALQ